jgi:hypothetical protein
MMRAPDGLGAVRRKYEAAKKGEEDLLALRGGDSAPSRRSQNARIS